MADWGEGDFGAGVTLGWWWGKLGDGLDWGETVGFKGAASLLLVGGHLGADAGGAVLAEATGVDGWRGDVFVGLGRHTGELSGEVNFHLLGVGLDGGVTDIAFRAADAVRWMTACMG